MVQFSINNSINNHASCRGSEFHYCSVEKPVSEFLHRVKTSPLKTLPLFVDILCCDTVLRVCLVKGLKIHHVQTH